ncbi:MAG: TetM/TetW/TetO/TetS family tetracycline resistance ribosomal protection protein [Clostridia bacterium]|nr:TetM/TetW/TetO/TetS family tetracycline resistance ribosomal protection protein [Clostridia bacterium]
MEKKLLSVGILAHVDAGKTTLSEALLYAAGSLKKRGRVDHGDSVLDTFSLERQRGITIFSKLARFSFGDTVFHLLDTPGHVDFSAETERTLQVLDYAILVVSGTDGVQSHTRTLWGLLEKYRVPCFLFVNKTDLPGTDRAALMKNLQTKLSDACVDFTAPEGDAFYEEAALCDEALLEEYGETGKIGDDGLVEAVRRRRLFPCFFGAALKMEGVDAFLRGLDRYTRAPAYGDRFAAVVYKLAEDPAGEKLTFLKVTGGKLSVKDVPESPKNTEKEKVQQIRLYTGDRFTAADTAPAGTVCAVTGLSFTIPGDGLGAQEDGVLPVLVPVMTYAVQLPEGGDVHKALSALKALEREDPALCVQWDPQTGLQVRLMGDVQLEILREVLRERFSLDVGFGKGRVVYKETIAAPAEGVGHFEPLRHYAEVHLLLKPLPRDSGLRFNTDCREDLLDRNWQRLILTHLYEKTHVGVLTGAPVTDMEITLRSGKAHLKHTEGGDFRQATYRAVRQGLRSAESLLLEPLYDFTLELPTVYVGRALTDLTQMGASFSAPVTAGDLSVITGSVPASEIAEYPKTLAHDTRGTGRLSCVFRGYAPCHNAEEVIRETGYDPDRDTDNPCDSVFCAHGAGYTVRWDEVKSRMHLPSILARPAPAAPAAQTGGGSPAARKNGGRDIFALDKELIRIFEQTYGPIKARKDPFNVHTAPQKQTARKPKEMKIPDRFSGRQYVLVDGYNVIFSWKHLRELAEGSMNDARDALINLLCSYQGFKQCEVILVFDAYRVKSDREIERHGGITVVYTKEAETADAYIEKASYELAKENRVSVVSSDGMEQIIIAGNGALRISAETFYEEIGLLQKEIREAIEAAAGK